MNHDDHLPSSYEALATIAKAMAHGARLELLESIAQGEQSVETLARQRGSKVTTTSSHLQVLKAAGLVRTRRERTTVYYRLAGPDVAGLFVAMKAVGHSYLPALGVTSLAENPFTAAKVEQVLDLARARKVFILDVRPHPEYLSGHLLGAVSIPFAELETRLHEIPQNLHVVVYCRGELCHLADQAAELLRACGVSANAMNEGVLEWRATDEITLVASA